MTVYFSTRRMKLDGRSNACSWLAVQYQRAFPTRVPVWVIAGAAWVLAFSGITECQSVSGIVRDVRGKAVRSAEIAVERAGSRVDLKTNSIGAYSNAAAPGGGRVRISVTAQGFEPMVVEATVPDRTPSCQADFKLFKKGQRKGQSQPSVLGCSEPLPPPPPYAAMLSFDAKVNCAPPVTRCGNMQLFGRYALQTTPAVRQPVSIHVAGAPASASWVLSVVDVANLTRTDPQGARLEFAKDGDTDLTLVSEGRVLLRIRIRAQTFADTWQVLADRVTEKGEVIDAAGNVVK